MPNDKKFRDFNINKKHLLSTHLMGTPVYIHLLQRKIEKKNGFKNIKSFHLMGFSQSQKFKQIKRTKTYTQAKRSLTFFFGRSTKNNLKLINFTFFVQEIDVGFCLRHQFFFLFLFFTRPSFFSKTTKCILCAVFYLIMFFVVLFTRPFVSSMSKMKQAKTSNTQQTLSAWTKWTKQLSTMKNKIVWFFFLSVSLSVDNTTQSYMDCSFVAHCHAAIMHYLEYVTHDMATLQIRFMFHCDGITAKQTGLHGF